VSLPHFIERFVGSVVASVLAIVIGVASGHAVVTALSHDGVVAARHVLDCITDIAITVVLRTHFSHANLCVVIHNGDRLGGGVGVDGLDRSKARPAAVGRMLLTLFLHAAGAATCHVLAMVVTQGVSQYPGWGQGRVQATSTIVGAPTVALLRAGVRPAQLGLDQGGAGAGTRQRHLGLGRAVRQGARPLLVNEEGVDPEVEQFASSHVARLLSEVKDIHLDLLYELYLDVTDD